MVQFVIDENDAHQTIIKFMRKTFNTVPLRLLYKLFRFKKIKLNGEVITDLKYYLKPNDTIIVLDNLTFKDEVKKQFASQIALTIIYEDEYILIVDKPHNVLIHHPVGDCLDLAVRKYLQINNSYSFTISHVHRLDKLTRGLVIYAKKKIALNIFHQFWNQNNITKKYLALLATNKELPLVVKGYIFQDIMQGKMVFSPKLELPNCKVAVTKFKMFKKVLKFSWYEIQLITGRKHQIRASCEYLKTPIVGDIKYDSKYNLNDRIMLFAYKLEFKNLPVPLDYLNNKQFVLPDIDKILEINSREIN